VWLALLNQAHSVNRYGGIPVSQNDWSKGAVYNDSGVIGKASMIADGSSSSLPHVGISSALILSARASAGKVGCVSPCFGCGVYGGVKGS